MSISPPLSRFALALVAAFAAAPAFAGDTFYQGRATAVQGTLTLSTLSQSILISDNGLSCQGTPKEETLSDTRNTGQIAFSAQTAYTFTQGRDQKALAIARLQAATLDVPGLKVGFSAIEATAQATCDVNRRVTVQGSSSLVDLVINGQRQTISGQPNQTITIPNVATITVNEQTQGARELQVTGLHVVLFPTNDVVNGDLRISATRAKITCTR